MEIITIPHEVFKGCWEANAVSSQAANIDKAIGDLKKTFEACFSGMHSKGGGGDASGAGGAGGAGSVGGHGDYEGNRHDGRHGGRGGGGNSRDRDRERDHRKEYRGSQDAREAHRPNSSRNGGHWGAQRDGARRDDGFRRDHGGSHGAQRRGHGGGFAGHRRHERPRIGVRDLCREDISRKDFMANMNKMSPQNYDAILRHIRTTYNSNFLQNYMDIVWNMMTRQIDYQELYILVIQHLLDITPTDKKGAVLDYWNDRCKNYFESHAWMPANDLLDSITEEYDEFCDYIKWKKHTAASLTGWLRLMRNGIVQESYERCFDTIMQQTDEAIQQSSHRLLDCFLEWLLRMVGVEVSYIYPGSYSTQLNDWMTVIKDRGLSSALRFKIIDILKSMEVSAK